MSKLMKIIFIFVFVKWTTGKYETDCNNESNGKAIPSSESCHKYFICNDGSPIEMTCPGNSFFHRQLGVCDFSYDDDCSSRTPYGIPNVGHVSEGISTRASDGFELPECCTPILNTTEISCRKKSGSFAYPGNCSQYIKCKDWNPTIEKCKEDRYWDEEEEECKKAIPNCEPPPPPICCLPQDAAIVCPSKSGSFAFRGNCQQYIKCKQWYPSIEICNDNMFWDQYEGECKKAAPICRAAIEPTTVTPSEPNTTIITTSVSYITSSELPNITESMPTSSLPNVTYTASPNITVSLTTHLPPTTLDPNPIPTYPICCKEVDNTVISCINKVVNDSYPFPGVCSLYYTCVDNNRPFINQCVSNNSEIMFWNQDRKECVFHQPNCFDIPFDDESTPEPIPIPSCCIASDNNEVECYDENAGESFPYRGNCHKYITCTLLGVPLIETCPNDNYWDEVTKKCVPDEPYCYGDLDPTSTIEPTELPIPTDSTTEGDTPTLAPTQPSIQTVSPTEPSITTESPTEPSIPTITPNLPEFSICCIPNPNPRLHCYAGDTYLPFPGDCRRYIHCVNGWPIIGSCPTTEYWREDLMNCSRFGPLC